MVTVKQFCAKHWNQELHVFTIISHTIHMWRRLQHDARVY